MTTQVVNDKLIYALSKQATIFGKPVTEIQLHFSWMGKMKYQIMHNWKFQKTATLRDLIGWNFYNGLIENALIKAIKRAADTIQAKPEETGIIASTQDGKIITITAQQNDKIVKQLLITDIKV